jgi:hypothetical protein
MGAEFATRPPIARNRRFPRPARRGASLVAREAVRCWLKLVGPRGFAKTNASGGGRLKQKYRANSFGAETTH